MLRWLFLDMNSYFASVEQQNRPELRGRPIIVAPVNAETTCAIAASYEAKKFGIKTGTPIWQAREMCPDLQIVIADDHQVYTKVHDKIKQAVESCVPVKAVLSIDEMACRLLSNERDPEVAIALAKKIKEKIYADVGECLRCSIGIAPNRWLAKIAADMQKPDGLTVLYERGLPQSLYGLELTDLPGVGRQMHKRLLSHGVGTVKQLCELSEKELRKIWHSYVGETWWHWLRGFEIPEKPTHRRTVGHSHVLAPKFRTRDGARAVLIRLIHKAAARLRSMNYWAGRMSVYVSAEHGAPGWGFDVALGSCQDTPTMVETFTAAWQAHFRAGVTPKKVSLTLYNLNADFCATLPLFAWEEARLKLSKVMDRANAKFGRNKVYTGAMHDTRDAAPTRIAFNTVPEFKSEYS